MSDIHSLGDLYTQDMTNCYADAIGSRGVSRTVMADYQAKIATALETIKSEYDAGTHPLWRYPERTDDLAEMRHIADMLQTYDDVVILGTGGSSLGAQALQLLAKNNQGAKRLHIVANVDPYVFHQKMAHLDFVRTGFLVISKSGETTETIMQFLTLLPQIKQQIAPDAIKRHIVFITEQSDNSMRQLASRFDCAVLPHDPHLGGRYSVLSNVGMLPAMILGLPAEKLRAGAHQVIQAMLAERDLENLPFVVGAALNLAMMASGVSNTVMLAYSDRLGSLARWHRQLWAESIGKDGHGTTPIYAMGPVDQHSQLQLWLGGPQDKLFNVLTHPHGSHMDNENMPMADTEVETIPALGYMQGRTLADLMDMSRRATTDTLVAHGCPVRQMIMHRPELDNMGAVMMHFMLETVLVAHVLGINPYDQPAVEDGKMRLKDYMIDDKGGDS